MKIILLTILVVGMVDCMLGDSMELNRQKRQQMECPIPAEKAQKFKEFLKECQDKDLKVPSAFKDLDNAPCPPSPDMMKAFMKLMGQAVAKGIKPPPM